MDPSYARAQQGQTAAFLTAVPSQAEEETELQEREGLENIDERIMLTEKRMLDFEAKALYIEAEKQRRTLDALKKRSTFLGKDEFREHWKSEFARLQANVLGKEERLRVVWSEKGETLRQREAQMLGSLYNRHQKSMNELTKSLKHKVKAPKWSPKLLALRKKQYLLGKTKRYLEAEKLRREADLLEREEYEINQEKLSQSSRLRVNALLQRQEKELEQLKDKLERDRKHFVESESAAFDSSQSRARRCFDELRKQYEKAKSNGVLRYQSEWRRCTASVSSDRKHYSTPFEEEIVTTKRPSLLAIEAGKRRSSVRELAHAAIP